MSQETTAQIFHKPNWHPALSSLLGDITDQEGYVTEYGTIELIGNAKTNPVVSRYEFESNINGPTVSLTAQSSLGL